MSDIMLVGVLNMPYEMAMSSELSRTQYYQRAQQAIKKLDELEELLSDRQSDLTFEYNRAEELATEKQAILVRELAASERYEQYCVLAEAKISQLENEAIFNKDTINIMQTMLEEARAEVEELTGDKLRIDWLADRDNHDGNVQPPASA